MKKLLAIVLCLVMVLSIFGCTASKEPEKIDLYADRPLGSYYTGDANYVKAHDFTASLHDYYAQYEIECDNGILSKNDAFNWVGGADVKLPTPKREYTVGFSCYCTFDEVGAMYYKGMQDACKEAGIKLNIQDANYEQDKQNEWVEQQILEKVDAVIMTACDFYGCKEALDALEAAGIPVITLDAPPCAGNTQCCVMYDGVEQGQKAGEFLLEKLQNDGVEMKGKIYFGTLPYKHPNADTREFGFRSVFKDFPDVEVKALTGEEADEHYTAFEGILLAESEDIIGLWGLYSSATIGIMNAVKAGDYNIPITSVDNDRIILEGVYNGEILSTICYGAVEGSRLALAATINYLNGEGIPSIIYQGNTIVSKDNVEEAFEIYYGGATLKDYMNAEAAE